VRKNAFKKHIKRREREEEETEEEEGEGDLLNPFVK
jgi:hypothetical protein